MFKTTFVSLVFVTAIGSAFAYDKKSVLGVDLIESGDFNKISRSLENGAKLNSFDEYGISPLVRALAFPYLKPELVEFLIDKGADVNLPNNDGTTPIFFAIESEIFELLLDAGANINYKTPDGITPLISALYEHNHYGAMKLVEHVADVNVLSPEGTSPLNILRQSKNPYWGDFQEKLESLIIARGGKDIWTCANSKISGRRKPYSGDVDCQTLR